ncbi:hypothetical protein [Plesiomonas shigelloides]|uniref:hypothetical protein n=1 Tax=Plesiomonas shigelloides TaxID=703 RepID=UPI0031B79396
MTFHIDNAIRFSMNICDKCKEFGLRFNRRYKPEEFIEGKLSSEVWIVGLNPAAEEDWTDGERDAKDLSDYFNDIEKIHPYFKDFKKVSPSLFGRFGKEGGVAHTDLIKCSSKRWPPSSCKGRTANNIINNCKTHLFNQILSHKLKFIICNGAPVRRHIKEILE